MNHILPPLPYSFAALEPYIDAKTMEIHHGKHHCAYLTNLNKGAKRRGSRCDHPAGRLAFEHNKHRRRPIFCGGTCSAFTPFGQYATGMGPANALAGGSLTQRVLNSFLGTSSGTAGYFNSGVYTSAAPTSASVGIPTTGAATAYGNVGLGDVFGPAKTIGTCRCLRRLLCSGKARRWSSGLSFSTSGTTRSSPTRSLVPIWLLSARSPRLR